MYAYARAHRYALKCIANVHLTALRGPHIRSERLERSELGHGNCSSLRALDVLDVGSREETRSAAAGDSAEDNAVQQGVAAQAVRPMDAACGLASRVKATDHLVASAKALGRIVDLHAAHAIVDHGRHDRNVERVAGLQREVVEELL